MGAEVRDGSRDAHKTYTSRNERLKKTNQIWLESVDKKAAAKTAEPKTKQKSIFLEKKNNKFFSFIFPLWIHRQSIMYNNNLALHDCKFSLLLSLAKLHTRNEILPPF